MKVSGIVYRIIATQLTHKVDYTDAARGGNVNRQRNKREPMKSGCLSNINHHLHCLVTFIGDKRVRLGVVLEGKVL